MDQMVHFGPFWPEEVHFGPFRSANRTLAIPEFGGASSDASRSLFAQTIQADGILPEIILWPIQPGSFWLRQQSCNRDYVETSFPRRWSQAK